jgi:hypothetical protein
MSASVWPAGLWLAIAAKGTSWHYFASVVEAARRFRVGKKVFLSDFGLGLSEEGGVA